MASPSLESLLETLATSDIEFIVVGLLAAVAQGAPAPTHDLEIVHRRTPENIAKLLDVLVNELDARYRGRTDVLRPTAEIVPTETDARGATLIVISTLNPSALGTSDGRCELRVRPSQTDS